jgi:hypothetical protein
MTNSAIMTKLTVLAGQSNSTHVVAVYYVYTPPGRRVSDGIGKKETRLSLLRPGTGKNPQQVTTYRALSAHCSLTLLI